MSDVSVGNRMDEVIFSKVCTLIEIVFTALPPVNGPSQVRSHVNGGKGTLFNLVLLMYDLFLSLFSRFFHRSLEHNSRLAPCSISSSTR